jgi:hypothetical protein
MLKILKGTSIIQIPVLTELRKNLGFIERKFVQSGSSLLKQRNFKDVRILEQQIYIHMNNFVNVSFD